MDKHERKRFIEKLMLVSLMCVFIGVIAIIVLNFNSIYNYIGKVFRLTYPFIIGLFIAYLLTPITNKTIHRLKNTRLFKNKKDTTLNIIAIIIVESIFITCVIMLVSIIGSGVAGSGYNIIKQLPDAFEQTKDMIDEQIKQHSALKNIIGNTSAEFIANIVESVSKFVSDNFNEIATGVALNARDFTKHILNILLGIIISIFGLANREQFKRQSLRILSAFTSDRTYNKVIDIFCTVDKKFSRFFIGKIIDSAIIGVICVICMNLMQMPYAILVSMVVFITNIVPIIGPIIGAVPGVIIIFSESPIKALYFMIFIIILQQIDGHIIGPKCIGGATGLNTFYVLFALMVFGGIWGLVGMIIGVPLFAALYSLISEFISYRIELKNEKNNKEIKANME